MEVSEEKDLGVTFDQQATNASKVVAAANSTLGLINRHFSIGVNRPAFGGTVPHFHQMSRVPRNETDVPHFF